MDKKLINIISVFYSIFILIGSLILLSCNIVGDQSHYHNFYQFASKLDFFSSFLVYNSSLGTQEPIYFILALYFSRLLENNIFVAISNAILSFIVCRWILNQKLNLFSSFLFLTSNFYLIVLFTQTERLKFSLLFLTLALSLKGKSKIVVLISILTHIKSMFFVLINYVICLFFKFKRIIIKKQISLKKYLFCRSTFTHNDSVPLMFNHIIMKFTNNSSEGGFRSNIKHILLLFFIYYKRLNKSVIYSFLPLISGAFIVRDKRNTIFSIFIFSLYV